MDRVEDLPFEFVTITIKKDYVHQVSKLMLMINGSGFEILAYSVVKVGSNNSRHFYCKKLEDLIFENVDKNVNEIKVFALWFPGLISESHKTIRGGIQSFQNKVKFKFWESWSTNSIEIAKGLVVDDSLEKQTQLRNLINRTEEIKQSLQSQFPILEILEAGFRSVVYKVQHPEFGTCVLKKYRPGASNLVKSETQLRLLFPDEDLIPKLLFSDENSLLVNFFEDSRKHIRRALPIGRQVQVTQETAIQLYRFVHKLRDQNCFLLDLTSHNLIYDEQHGLKIIDTEFFFKYLTEPPAKLLEDFTIRGCYSAEYNIPELSLIDRACKEKHIDLGYSVFSSVITGMQTRHFISVSKRFATFQSCVTQDVWYILLHFYKTWLRLQKASNLIFFWKVKRRNG